MPKKTKALPDDRAEWTFGDALYWHFFAFGTRPDSSPRARNGTPWTPKEAAYALDVSVRGFWYWIDDRHLPYDTVKIEKALFGDSKLFADARVELRRLLDVGRSRPTQPATQGKVPAVLSGQAVTVYTTPFEASEVDGPVSDADFRAIAPFSPENFGNSWKTPPSGGALSPGAPARDEAGPAGVRPGASTPRSRKTVAMICAGVLAVLGVYGVKRALDYQSFFAGPAAPVKDPEPQIAKRDPAPAPPPVADPASSAAKARQPTEQERRADEERKRQDERRAAAQKKTLDELEEAQQKKQQAARDLNAKLKQMAQGDVDLCKQKLEGLSVPGFALKCDTLIPFGKLLKGVGVSQTASSLGDCAARCRRAPDCVAFSFDAGAHTGSASCYLTGSIPEMRKAENWIAGTR